MEKYFDLRGCSLSSGMNSYNTTEILIKRIIYARRFTR